MRPSNCWSIGECSSKVSPDATRWVVQSRDGARFDFGLVSFGLGWTVLRALSSIPDHGLWARGRERLYVHRGTGHYGFPLRLGVPAEQSVLRVHAPDRDGESYLQQYATS